jgi:hypothetical protein
MLGKDKGLGVPRSLFHVFTQLWKRLSKQIINDKFNDS